MKTILVAVDFSEVTEHVINVSVEQALLQNLSIRLLHVAEPPSAFLGDEIGPQVIRDIKAKTLKKEHSLIENYAKFIESKNIEVKPVVVQGATIETILEHAEKSDAKMIILGSKGRGAITKAILGSVTEGVIKDSNCPVLIIPVNIK